MNAPPLPPARLFSAYDLCRSTPPNTSATVHEHPGRCFLIGTEEISPGAYASTFRIIGIIDSPFEAQ